MALFLSVITVFEDSFQEARRWEVQGFSAWQPLEQLCPLKSGREPGPTLFSGMQGGWP